MAPPAAEIINLMLHHFASQKTDRGVAAGSSLCSVVLQFIGYERILSELKEIIQLTCTSYFADDN
jgi:hypothetical protein